MLVYVDQFYKFMSFFKKIVDKWKVSHPLPEETDLVVLLSYSASKTGLTQKSEDALRRALEVIRKYPNKIFGFGVAILSGQKGLEEKIKKERLVSVSKIIFSGNVLDTIEEALELRNKLGFTPKSIVVVADTCHSRRAFAVWKKVFPNSKIYIEAVPTNEEADHDIPHIFLRNKWVWLLSNVIGFLLVELLGLKLLRKLGLYQPILKS